MNTDFSSSINFFNGVEQGVIPFDDRGFLYGDGLFESMLLEKKHIPLINFHRKRLQRDCERLGISLDETRLLTYLDDVLNHPKTSSMCRAKVKVIVTRGSGGLGCYLPNDSSPNICIQVHEISDLKSQYVHLLAAHNPLAGDEVLAGIKHLSRLNYISASIGIDKSDNQEILFFDADRNVIETMHHNIFFAKDERLFTPKLMRCGVAGVMRDVIISQLAPRNNIEVIEEDISFTRALSFDACFLTNSVRGITSVARLDNHEYASTKTASLLSRALSDFKLEQCRVL